MSKKFMRVVELAANMSADYFEMPVTSEMVLSKRRDGHIVVARQLAVYFIRKNYFLTNKKIGQLFNRNHTTIIHTCSVVEDMLATQHEVYTAIYKDMVERSEQLEHESENVYTVVFPKYVDHETLTKKLEQNYNLKIIKHEGVFSAAS